MNPYVLFLIALGVAYLLIKFTKGLLFKILGVGIMAIAVILLAYLLGLGPFKKNVLSRSHIDDTFCTSEQPEDKAVCECIVQPYRLLLNRHFSEDELDEMERSHYECTYVFVKIYDQIITDAQQCTGQQDSAQILMQRFVTTLVPLLSTVEGWEKTKNNLKDSGNRMKKWKEKLEQKEEN
jgi:hypothetical protein